MSTPTGSSTAPEPVAVMRGILQRIATGPELSKDLPREEARAGMRLVLERRVDPVQAGVFLIALRMKRETDEENLGVLDAIREAAQIVTAPVEEVMDIADPYNGYGRSLPVSPFLPAVLAALGIPAVSHGLESVGPKHGVTHRQVLRAAGLAVDLTPEEAAARLGDGRVGWAYVDQAMFCPSLHALVPLRELIVKRPAITTVETLLGPIRGRAQTHLVTGYVHKAYPRVYALLARAAGFDSALIVRGVEGSVVPSLQSRGKVFHYRDGGEEEALEIQPADFGFEQPLRAVPLPEAPAPSGGAGAGLDTQAIARAAAEAGLAALAGKPGPVRDALVSAAALSLWHLGRCESLGAAANAVREVLDAGRALKRLES